jgi:hypothetical protein
VATIGITFSIQARFAESASIDLPIRLVLAALALFVLLCPNEWLGLVVSLPILAIIGYWLAVCRTSTYGAGSAPPEPAMAMPAQMPQIVDTERGRMQ